MNVSVDQCIHVSEIYEEDQWDCSDEVEISDMIECTSQYSYYYCTETETCYSTVTYEGGDQYTYDCDQLAEQGDSTVECPAGYYCQGTEWYECPMDYYCPIGSTEPTACPSEASSTEFTGATSAAECISYEDCYTEEESGDCMEFVSIDGIETCSYF
jgi:hypothetical protein